MRYLIVLIIILSNNILYSQIKIAGKIHDRNNKPIEFVKINLLKNDSTTVNDTFTDNKGRFLIKTQAGKYDLQIKNSGEVIYTKSIDVISDLDLGILKVETVNNLEEVIIEGKKKLIEHKVDRLVFNVENSLSVAGGDALDALKVTPYIRVQNDQISMIGKSGMSVMVDDRLIQLSGDELTSFLKSIRADDIKSIEVITNPPAKYSAEGNSGIINIKLKKSKQDSWNATLNSTYSQATYPTGTGGGTFNYQKDKIALTASSNYSKGSIQNVFTTKAFYPTETWNEKIIMRVFNNSLSNRFGIDYQTTKKVSIGAQYIGSYSDPDVMDRDITHLNDNMTNLNNGIIQTNGYNNRKRNSNMLNAHSVIELDTLGRKISVDVDYLNYEAKDNRNFHSETSNSDGTQIPNGFKSANNATIQNIDNFSTQINVDQPLKWMNFSYGTKLSFSNTNNAISYFDTTNGAPVFDPSQSDLFKYKENSQAFYVSGNKKFDKDKWQMQVGLRSESTQTTGNSISYNQTRNYNYTRIFPTAYITYTPVENHSFSLDYSKRISRPGFWELNPFKWYISPYTYTEGNPYLRPSYSHNLELKHSYKNCLFTSLYYSQIINGSGQVPVLSQDNYTQIFTRLNYYDGYSTGLAEVYVFNKLKWFESQNMVYGYFQHSDSKLYPLTPKSVEGLGMNVSTTNTFTLNANKTILAGFSFAYNSPSKSTQMFYGYATNQLNIFARIFLLNKKLQISITGINLLKSYDFTVKRYSNSIEVRNTGYNDSRNFRLSLIYKFGSSKISERQRNGSNEDEKRRIN